MVGKIAKKLLSQQFKQQFRLGGEGWAMGSQGQFKGGAILWFDAQFGGTSPHLIKLSGNIPESKAVRRSLGLFIKRQ
jgi:hypothetical protein